jgi:hypothetical protein
MFGEYKSKAGRRYIWTVSMDMVSYVLILFGVSAYVHRHHPVDWQLFVLAALPSIPIIGVLIAVGVYLRGEKDEYQRDMMVKCILWGTAGVLSLSTFTGFLHSFGWIGSISPFAEFVLFWVLVAVAKVFYRIVDRPRQDDVLREGGK